MRGEEREDDGEGCGAQQVRAIQEPEWSTVSSE